MGDKQSQPTAQAGQTSEAAGVAGEVGGPHSRNFMVEGEASAQVVGLQANEAKGLHYIGDVVSGSFAAAGTWGERMRGGGWAGKSQPSFSKTSRCSGSGCV